MDDKDNIERPNLERYQNKDDKYVFLHFCPQNKLNCLTDLGKETRSLINIIGLLFFFYK